MGLFESCKEVKFGTMNTRAIEFIGGGAKNFRGILNFFPLRHANKCTDATICMVVPLHMCIGSFIQKGLRKKNIF